MQINENDRICLLLMSGDTQNGLTVCDRPDGQNRLHTSIRMKLYSIEQARLQPATGNTSKWDWRNHTETWMDNTVLNKVSKTW